VNINNVPGLAGVNRLQGAIDVITQTNVPSLTVNISQGISAVNQLQSKKFTERKERN
jgi:hypothetical protein